MRLSGGRITKAKEGGFAGGGVAMGYTSKDKELETDKKEAKIVKAIFKLKKNKHLSINEIARRLNNEGFETKRGGRWYASTISYILKNPIYKGFYEYSGIEFKRNDLAISSAC